MDNAFGVERYDALPPGTELHGYRVEDVLGCGGFGITYLSVHGILNTQHVIKEFIPDCAVRDGGSTVRPRSGGAKALFDWGLKSFFDEACLLHRLAHPNVVKVTDVFKANGTAYFVMPYLKGQTLHQWLKEHPAPTRKEIEDIFIPLLEALKYIHREGLLHRDIKPENIYIRENGTPVLIDFGAARQAIGQASKTLTQVLTAHFAPIEQYSSRGDFTAALDLYSLAACLYVAVTGALPDEAPERLMHDRLPKLADDAKYEMLYGRDFLAAIDKAMAVKPADRFQSAFDFQKALLGLDAPPAPPPAPMAPPVAPPQAQPVEKEKDTTVEKSAKKGWGRLFAATVVVLALAGAALFFFSGRESPSPQPESPPAPVRIAEEERPEPKQAPPVIPQPPPRPATPIGPTPEEIRRRENLAAFDAAVAGARQLARDGRHDAAARAFEQALAMEGAANVGRIRSELAEAKQKAAEAKRFAEAVAEAERLVGMGRYADAVGQYEAALAVPGFSAHREVLEGLENARLLLALVEERQRERAEAEQRAAEVDWQPLDLAAAMNKAASERKLVYILVEGDDCPPCDKFLANHLSDPVYVDFVNTLYVPIRAHETRDRAFLESIRLTHAAVPRFYTLTAEGRGVSMSIGNVATPPMGAAMVLELALGRELPIDQSKGAALAARIRAHAANRRASGSLNQAYPLRHIGLALLESQAWALAGRLDEAEKAFGRDWADRLEDEMIIEWYINFWLAWNRNAPGVLEAAREYRDMSPEEPFAFYLLARALAANGRLDEAVAMGESYFSLSGEKAPAMKTMLAWYREAAKLGNADAQNRLGRAYNNGVSVEQDFREAVKWFRMAAEQGHAEAQNRLGLAYDSGNGVEKSLAEAAKWFRKAAENGFVWGQYNLGTSYRWGHGVPQDKGEAVQWYRKAAGQGLLDAQKALASIHFFGEGIAKDTAEGAKWYRLAAEQGDADSQERLGRAYEKGEGVPKNPAEALKWLRLAAEQGDKWVQSDLGRAYSDGSGVAPARDDEEAFKWFRLAAGQGVESARIAVGQAYRDGKGVARDTDEAMAWFLKAVEQGNTEAMNELGLTYRDGLGVPKDQAKALEWFHKAAAKNDSKAQYNIGQAYEQGLGVPRDGEEAVRWWGKAAVQGHMDALERLRERNRLRDFGIHQLN